MARVVWHDDALIQSVDLALDRATKKGAEFIARRMRRNATRDDEMVSAISVKKSNFKDGGHIAGVFSPAIPPSGKWEDSVAARAIYQDYGHAKPYQGRGHKQGRDVEMTDSLGRKSTRFMRRKLIVKSVPGNHFIRKALRSGRRVIPKYFEGALKG